MFTPSVGDIDHFTRRASHRFQLGNRECSGVHGWQSNG
jgi:hypothetical protein